MRRLSHLIMLSMVVLSGVNCGKDQSTPMPSPSPPQEPERGSIVFVVVDSVTGEPVPEVSIILGMFHRSWTVTSSHGVGIVSDIPVGEYNARFYASGYEFLQKSVVVEKDEKIVDVALTPVTYPDTVAPEILMCDKDGADLWVIFSEAMDTASFENSVSGEWTSYSPCEPEDSFDSWYFTMHWIHRNILHIDHEETETWHCFYGNGMEEEESPWMIDWISIDSTVTDLYGNHLRHSFYYSGHQGGKEK